MENKNHLRKELNKFSVPTILSSLVRHIKWKCQGYEQFRNLRWVLSVILPNYSTYELPLSPIRVLCFPLVKFCKAINIKIAPLIDTSNRYSALLFGDILCYWSLNSRWKNIITFFTIITMDINSITWVYDPHTTFCVTNVSLLDEWCHCRITLVKLYTLLTLRIKNMM